MFNKLFPYLLFVSDWILGAGACLVSLSIFPGVTGSDADMTVLVTGAFTVNAAFLSFRLYNRAMLRDTLRQFLNIAKGAALSLLLFITVSFFFGSEIITGHPFIAGYFAIIGFIGISFWRIVVMRTLYIRYDRKNVARKNLLIVSADYVGQLMAAKIGLNGMININVVGFLDNTIQRGVNVFKDKKVLGRVEEAASVIDNYSVDEVLYCFGNGSYPFFQQILDTCNKANIKMRIASPFFDVASPRFNDDGRADITVTYDFYPDHSIIFGVTKRIIDVVFSLVGGILLIPVFAVIAVAIKIDSPGPVLYIHTRLGKDGKPFRFYKFRSMIVDSDKDERRRESMEKFINGNYDGDNGSTKIVDESKVTRVGKILRRFSVDELPQLYNVLKGDMSLVGPRPCLPYEWEEYDEWHKKRLSVIPGCTGLWQVAGRSKVGFNDMVILDLYYIQNSSIHLDLKLILQTFPVMLLGKGGE